MVHQPSTEMPLCPFVLVPGSSFSTYAIATLAVVAVLLQNRTFALTSFWDTKTIKRRIGKTTGSLARPILDWTSERTRLTLILHILSVLCISTFMFVVGLENRGLVDPEDLEKLR
jgi:hypothetical protein